MNSLLLLSLLSAVLMAHDWKCFLSVFKVNGEEITNEQISESYLNILKELAPNLSQETMEKMVERGTPFEIPKEHNASSSTLSETLKEFKEILEASGRNTEEIKKFVLEALGKSQGIRKGIEQKQAVVDKKTEGAVSITWPESGNPKPVFSPDGRYTLVPGQKDSSLWVSDRGGPLKKIQPIGPVEGRFDNFKFSHDGKHVFYTIRNRKNNVAHLLYKAQVIDGNGALIETWAPELWATLAKIKGFHRYFGEIEHSADGKWMVGNGSRIGYLIPADVKPQKNIGAFVDIDPFGDSHVTFMPDGREIINITTSAMRFYDLKGNESRPEVLYRKNKKVTIDIEMNASEARITSNGKKMYAPDWDKGLAVVDIASGVTKTFDLVKGRANGTHFGELVIDANEKHAIIIRKNRQENENGALLVVNLNNGRIVNQVNLAGTKPESIRLNGTGDAYVVSYGGLDKMTVHRIEDLIP